MGPVPMCTGAVKQKKKVAFNRRPMAPPDDDKEAGDCILQPQRLDCQVPATIVTFDVFF